jgi:hypothetical protein
VHLISDTIRAHLDVWTAMNALGSLATAMGRAHERLRSRNIWVRPAMALLKRLEEAGSLDTRTKTQMQMDYASLHQVGRRLSRSGWREPISDLKAGSTSQSLHSISHHSSPPPAVIPEIRTLARDAPPTVCSQLANTLWYKYYSYEQWGFVAWTNIVAAAAADANLAVDRLKERGLEEDAHVHLLVEVHERLGDGVGPFIQQWIKANVANPSNLTALLTNFASLVRLLVLAVAHDIVPMASVLGDFVCPILAMLHRCPSPGAPSRCLVWMLSVLLTQPTVDQDLGHGVGRVDAEHLHARRSLIFSPGLFPCIVRLTALLVKCEKVVVDRDAPESLRQEFVDLRREIWKDPNLRAAFLRESQATMGIVLNSDADDEMRGRLLDALLEMLGEAGPCKRRKLDILQWVG